MPTSLPGSRAFEQPPPERLQAPAGLPELVAHRPHGRDEVGVLLAELGPQPADVDVDRPGASVVLVAPHPVEQHLPGEHLARVLARNLSSSYSMYVRSSGRPPIDAWYVSRLRASSRYSIISGRDEPPTRQRRWRTRASNSAGWNGLRQKSSNSS